MDKCPPEIHARIFSFACTDDGAAGRSLSIVSKYVREVSAPYQWQSVALAGHEHIIKFAQVVNDMKGIRPIYHLFLSDRGSSAPTTYFVSSNGQQLYQSIEVRDALMSLMKFAAPTLITLSFYSVVSFLGGGASVALLLSISYPRLTELTIRGRCTPVQLASLSQTLAAIPSEMPNLRYLHLALPYHGFVYGNLAETRNLVRIIAPHITHFRLSMLDMWGSKHVAEVIHAELARRGIVKKILDLPDIQCDAPAMAIARPVTWDPLLPDSLELFVIQPSPTMNFYCSCCMDYRGDVDVMRIFERMSEEADDQQFRFLSRRSSSSMGYGAEEAKHDWMDRLVEGGNGCWKIKEECLSSEDGDSRNQAGTSSSPRGNKWGSAASRWRDVVRRLKLW